MELITTHLNADFDSLAAMIAARKLYPGAALAFAGSQEKNLRDFLAQSPGYLYDFERLKNLPLDRISRLIVVDTRQPSRLGPLAACLDNPGLEIHLYDHHPDAAGDLKGSLEVIRPVGSTTTIFCGLLREKGLTLSPEEATLMALGIYEDTGAFLFAGTTPDDLAAAAWLLEQGANLHTVSQFIAQELTSAEVRLLHDLIRATTSYTIHGIEISVARLTIPDYVNEFAVVVRRLMVMENLNTLFALANMGDRTYLIARSRIPEVNAGEIAREFGGGGHASAASATIKEMTLIEAEEKLLQALHRHVHPAKTAGEIMSSPAITAPADITINAAEEMLNRYNITVLPLMDENNRIIGLLSRRVAGKAIHLGLGGQSAGEYMTTDFATLPPTATFADIQELIIENRQRIIPVVRQGELKGVITRTDLLNLLVNDPLRLPRNLVGEPHPSSERHRNLQNLMVERLARPLIVLLRTIGETAEEMGFHAFAVGGFVRDLLLHKKNLDLDIVIEGNGIVFAKQLAARLGGEVRAHRKFNTAMVKLPDGRKVDVATARLEYYDYPAAMPTVELASLKLDLYRRDFTINALAIHLNPENYGLLVDFFNGQNDLQDKKIRVLHNLSFVEDPTRILRAVRFEQRMGFAIGRHTERLIKNAVRMEMFDRFSGARFFGELRQILDQENPLPAIRRLAELGVFPFLHPNLRLDPRLERILGETQAAVAWHQLLYREEPCRAWLVYLLALTAILKHRELLDFCQKFEVAERYCRLLATEKNEAQRAATLLRRRVPRRNSEIYHLLSGLGPEGLLYLMGLIPKKAAKKAISLYVTELRQVRGEVDGHDLQRLGYPAGPLYRTVLDHLLDARLDDLVRSRAEELALLNSAYPLPLPAATAPKETAP